MADITGTLHREVGGKDYALRLTMRDIATLQGEYGINLGGWLSEKQPEIVDFGLALDVVTLAVKRGSKLDRAAAEDVADDLLTADVSLFGKVMTALFVRDEAGTKAAGGNAQAPADQQTQP